MKKLLPIFFILLAFTTKAQIINMPDPVFKNYLISQLLLDTNGDGEIQVSEALQVTILEIGNIAIQDLTGINSFSNLQILKLQDLLLSTLEINGLPKLNYLELLRNHSLTTFTLNNLPLLNNVLCNAQHTNLSSLNTVNLLALPALQVLNVGSNKLTTLDLAAAPGIRTLFIGSNSFATMPDISMLTGLNTLNCGGNPLTSIDVSGYTNLEEFNCNLSPLLTSFNIHNCVGLKRLYCSYNPGLTSLDLSNHNLANLTNVFTQYCSLTSLNTTGVSNLLSLACSNNQLTELDLSSNFSLNNLSYTFNPQLRAINAKNGPASIIVYDYAEGCPNLQYICTDENEISVVPGRPDISINSYCTFTPGGAFYNTIKGIVKADLNNNGCDASDAIIPGMVMKVALGTQTAYTTIDTAGKYSYYATLGNYAVTPQYPRPYFTFAPPSASINFTITTSSTQVFDFCMTANGVHPDLEVVLLPVNQARPGFNATYQLVYKNNGTTTQSGNISLAFDDLRLDFLSAIPAISAQVADILTWAYVALLPLESRTIDISFNLLPPPVNNLNDTLRFAANINPLAGDEVPLDNSFALKQVIRGSFDPNDKTCLEGSAIDITHVGDYVHYLVRFQNTGTDTAFNVVVKDILSNKLDWNTFELTKSSHPFVLRQTAGNKLEFIFENISLPDSNVNEPASHGYIAFKIKTVGTLLPGDQVDNNGSIYFDYNLPVITNTASFTIGTGIVIPIKIEYFKGFADAGKHFLNWKASCTSSQAIFDIERSTDGRNYNSIETLTASYTRCLQPFDLIDENPIAGLNYYRIKMTDVDGKSTYSTTIALLNKTSGFEIVSLMPNPVVGGTATLNITSAEKQPINIIVTDASGKIVTSINAPVATGFTQFNINVMSLAPGVYTIGVYTKEGDKKTKQFIKQ